MFAVVAGLLALWSAPALAHNSLVESAPAKDARLAAPPAEVKLRFLSNLDKNTQLTVTDATGASAIGAVTVDGKFLSAPFTGTAPGVYTVTYALISSDGHPVKSSFTFGIDAPPSPSVAPVAQPEPTRSPAEAAAAPEKKSQETPWFPYIGGAAVAGLAVGALIAFLKKRRETQAR
jgi:methionine-rich copper-binding protein CopC